MTETLDSLRVSIPKDQIVALQRYTWPGNVRELRHVIERAVIVSKGPRLLVEPPRARLARRARACASPTHSSRVGMTGRFT